MVSLNQRWPNVFVNQQYVRSDNTITWPKRERVSVEEPSKMVLAMVESRQYSMQVLEDGSPVQIYYAFDHRGMLLEGSLGFYFAGGSHTSDEPDDADIFPLTTPTRQTGWIRLDFDPSAATDIAHYAVHLHSSLCQDMRIPVSRMPTPKEFADLILLWFYPAIYREHRLQNGIPQIPREEARNLHEPIIPSSFELGDLVTSCVWLPAF